MYRTLRPRQTDKSILSPFVAWSEMGGRLAPQRWRTAPSSAGGGICDQSGVSTISSKIASSVLHPVADGTRSEDGDEVILDVARERQRPELLDGHLDRIPE
jgi:hypothetical protein